MILYIHGPQNMGCINIVDALTLSTTFQVSMCGFFTKRWTTVTAMKILLYAHAFRNYCQLIYCLIVINYN